MQYNHDNIRLGAKRNRKVSFLLLYNVQCFGVGGHLICKTATATSAQTARWPLDRSGRGTLINVDICRLTKHILHNTGQWKQGQEKFISNQGAKSLLVKPSKVWTAVHQPKKEAESYVLLLTIEQTKKERKGGREGSWALAKTDRNVPPPFQWRPVSKSMLLQIH